MDLILPHLSFSLFLLPAAGNQEAAGRKRRSYLDAAVFSLLEPLPRLIRDGSSKGQQAPCDLILPASPPPVNAVLEVEKIWHMHMIPSVGVDREQTLGFLLVIKSLWDVAQRLELLGRDSTVHALLSLNVLKTEREDAWRR